MEKQSPFVSGGSLRCRDIRARQGEGLGEVTTPEHRNRTRGLTAVQVRNAGPGKHHDGTGAGLFLRVDPTGGRFWVQRLTIRGKRREIGLGSYPLISLAEARQAALDNKRIARLGRDPLAELRRARETLTFAEAAEAYMASKLEEFRNEKHRRQWRATLDTYAIPIIGTAPVRALEVAD
ncbi:MAG: DUF4102 domain-containing protein, partial [Rhodobacteraceae bacterium]|nr:DUF4102 domain-containing protein [Paracoccaceae bacterium]